VGPRPNRVGLERARGLQERPDLAELPCDGDHVPHPRRLEALHGHPLEEAQELVIVPVVVEEDDLLVEPVDVLKRHDLRQLLQGSDAPGKREEGARPLLHDALPVAH